MTMAAKLVYIPKIPISSIENRIALLEVQGFYEQAEGLRDFFAKYIREEKVEKLRVAYNKVIQRLEKR